MTFDTRKSGHVPLRPPFRRLPLAAAAALVCAQLEAAPAIDFNGQNQWIDRLDDGTLLSHISVSDSANGNPAAVFTLTVGDGTGTAYFKDISAENRYLIQNYGLTRPIGITLNGNLTISNVRLTGSESGFVFGHKNDSDDEHKEKNLGYFSMTGNLVVENSSSGDHGIFIHTDSKSHDKNYDSNVRFNDIRISDTSVAETLFHSDTKSFSANNIQIYGNPADLNDNDGFTAKARYFLDLLGTDSVTVGNIDVRHVANIGNGSLYGTDTHLIKLYTKGSLRTGDVTIRNSIAGCKLLDADGDSLSMGKVDIADIRLLDSRTRFTTIFTGYSSFFIDSLSIRNLTFEGSKYPASGGFDTNVVWLCFFPASPNPDPQPALNINQLRISHIRNKKTERGGADLKVVLLDSSPLMTFGSVDIEDVLSVETGPTMGLIEDNDSHARIATLNIRGITGQGSSYGIYQNPNNTAEIAEGRIETIVGSDLAAGLLSRHTPDPHPNSNTVTGKLSIADIRADGHALGYYAEKSLNALNGLSVRSLEGDEFSAAVAALDTADVTVNVADIGNPSKRADASERRDYALYADNSTLTVNAGKVTGDIAALNGAKVTLGNSDAAGIFEGDLLVADGSALDLHLNALSGLTGAVDDGWNAASARTVRFISIGDPTPDHEDFTDPAPITPSAPGTASILLKGGTWHADGLSFVTNLSFDETAGGTLDMRALTGHNAVLVRNMEGDGRIRMTFGKYAKDEDGLIRTDMLYVRNLASDAKYTIFADVDGSVSSLDDLNGIRFATTNALPEGERFVVRFEDQGVVNREYAVRSEAYDPDDPENVAYNGTGTGDGVKPGNDAVNEIFADGAVNWFLETGDLLPEPPDPDPEPDPKPQPPELSDAGSALIATARAAYWNAVDTDRYRNRTAETLYEDGTEGLWIRVRHERVGTDAGTGDFRSKNTTYQIGFDHAFPYGTGTLRAGLAVDYTDGETEYRGVRGDGETDRVGLAAYGTWTTGTGSYVDVVGRLGNLKNGFEIVNGSGKTVRADYDNDVMSFSLEVGHLFRRTDSGLFLEPSAQLQYARVTDASYATSQGSRIRQDAIDSLISRFGLRAGFDFGSDGARSAYVKADHFREFLGKERLHLRDATTSARGLNVALENEGNRFDVGFGFQTRLTKKGFLFVDAEHRFGNDLDRTWVFNAGARLAF